MIRQGKGKKDRLIPIGEKAITWIEKYVAETRPLLVREPDDGTLFPDHHQPAVFTRRHEQTGKAIRERKREQE